MSLLFVEHVSFLLYTSTDKCRTYLFCSSGMSHLHVSHVPLSHLHVSHFLCFICMWVVWQTGRTCRCVCVAWLVAVYDRTHASVRYGLASVSRIDKIIGLSAEYSLFYSSLLQQRPTILSMLLTVATPYDLCICGVSCHTYKWVRSHVYMSHVPLIC